MTTQEHMAARDLAGLAPVLRRAAVRAARAPSVHNTQPWRFVLRADHLELHADWTRQLPAYDPLGRQLLMSCACALLNMRAALAAGGYAADVAVFPDPGRSQLLATVTPVRSRAADAELGRLDPAIDTRHTNRAAFTAGLDSVSRDALLAAAAAEGALLVPAGDGTAAVFEELNMLAQRRHNADPAHRVELRAWTVPDADRRDGIPGGRSAFTQFLVHDRPGEGAPDLLVLCTLRDDRLAWIEAGEALERVLLGAAARGLAARTLTQIIEIPEFRARLSAELGLRAAPQAVLQVGHAPPGAGTRRRRLVDVITPGR